MYLRHFRALIRAVSGSVPPSPQHVLVLDDNRDLAENVAELFSAAGYSTEAVADGSGALDAAARRAFDLAVVDVRLPGDSGIRVAGELKAQCPEAEVILMTANATLDSAIAAIREDAYAYVQKPFDPAELLAIGERALGQVRLGRERMRLERELARSEALYRGVVDTVDRYIVALGRAGEVRMWNRSAAASSGWNAAEVLGRRLTEFLPSEHGRASFAETLAQAAGGSEVSDLELSVRTPDGSQRIVRWQLSQLPQDEPSAPSVLAVGADVTDRLDLERRAAEAEAMASIATLTAGLAHEIRNPLNAASLQLELLERASKRLEDGGTRGRIENRTRIVREELARLTNLLDDFLNLARPRAIALEEVPLGALIEEVVTLQEPAARKAGIELHARVPPDAPAVRGDSAMLKQVLVNLIVNAIDALRGREPRRDGGSIEVSCAPIGDARVELRVDDDGPGIPSEVADRLFVPFVTSKEAGSGLGLTIVKRIIDRHGGTIRVASKPTGGTRVRLYLERAS